MAKRQLKTSVELVYTEEFVRQVKRLSKKEPRLWDLIRIGVALELIKNRRTKIPGLDGWAKCRLPSPSQKSGKSGGYRLIFLYLISYSRVYLGEVYSKREQKDLSPYQKIRLKAYAQSIQHKPEQS